MIEEFIKCGSMIKIFCGEYELHEGFSGENNEFVSVGNIEKILTDDTIRVKLKSESEIIFDKKKNYYVFVYLADKVYVCNTKYDSGYIEEGVQSIIFCLESPFQSVQRRRHQRVSFHSDISVGVITEEHEKLIEKNGIENVASELRQWFHPLESSSLDLSGGGMRLVSQRELQPGSKLLMEFKVEAKNNVQESMCLMAEVVHSDYMRNDNETFDIRVKFIGISEEIKEKLIKCVFRCERGKKQ